MLRLEYKQTPADTGRQVRMLLLCLVRDGDGSDQEVAVGMAGSGWIWICFENNNQVSWMGRYEMELKQAWLQKNIKPSMTSDFFVWATVKLPSTETKLTASKIGLEIGVQVLHATFEVSVRHLTRQVKEAGVGSGARK